MPRIRKAKPRGGGPHHRAQVALWIVGIISPIVGGVWALFLYSQDRPDAPVVPREESPPIAFKAPPIAPPVLTIDSFFVGGFNVSISNPNPSMMSISRSLLLSPEGAFPLAARTRNLGGSQVTSIEMMAFDESPQGRSNLEIAKKKLMFMDYDTTNCTVQISAQDIAGNQHIASEEFLCGRILYMKNPPVPPK